MISSNDFDLLVDIILEHGPIVIDIAHRHLHGHNCSIRRRAMVGCCDNQVDNRLITVVAHGAVGGNRAWKKDIKFIQYPNIIVKKY